MLMMMPRIIPQQEHRPGHHANAWLARCAQGPSMPEGRAERAVEAERRALDGAERSGILKGVMAALQVERCDLPDFGVTTGVRVWS
jgi:hypothetical protein